MTATNFPASGTHTVGSIQYTYDSSKAVWEPAGADSSSGISVTVYATIADLPMTGVSNGDMAFVSANQYFYVYNSGWYGIYLVGNTAPIFTLAPATHSLRPDGVANILTFNAVDADGDAITWDWTITQDSNTYNASSGTLPNQITAVSNTNGTFTLTPSSNFAHEGSFTFTAFATSNGETTTASTTVDLTIFQSWNINTNFSEITATTTAQDGSAPAPTTSSAHADGRAYSTTHFVRYLMSVTSKTLSYGGSKWWYWESHITHNMTFGCYAVVGLRSTGSTGFGLPDKYYDTGSNQSTSIIVSVMFMEPTGKYYFFVNGVLDSSSSFGGSNAALQGSYFITQTENNHPVIHSTIIKTLSSKWTYNPQTLYSQIP